MKNFITVTFVLLITSCSLTSETTTKKSNLVEPPKSVISPQNLNCTIGQDCLDIILVDVGQGNTGVARLPDGTSILFDAGTSSSRQYALKNIKWAINKLNITRFDYVVLSHPDQDHTDLLYALSNDGFIDVTKNTTLHLSMTPNYYDVAGALEFFQKIYSTIPSATSDCNKLKKPQVKVNVICYNQKQTGLSVVQPNWPNSQNGVFAAYMVGVNIGSNPNANSLVSGAYYGNVKILLPGDAEGDTQKEIIASADNELYSDVDLYVLAHHGATTNKSNAKYWLEAMEPQSYVASSKPKSNWLHPNAEIIKDIVNSATLSNRLTSFPFSDGTHRYFQSYRGGNNEVKRCDCDFYKAITSTLTNGSITFSTDGYNFNTRYETKSANSSPNCPFSVSC